MLLCLKILAGRAITILEICDKLHIVTYIVPQTEL